MGVGYPPRASCHPPTRADQHGVTIARLPRRVCFTRPPTRDGGERQRRASVARGYRLPVTAPVRRDARCGRRDANANINRRPGGVRRDPHAARSFRPFECDTYARYGRRNSIKPYLWRTEGKNEKTSAHVQAGDVLAYAPQHVMAQRRKIERERKRKREIKRCYRRVTYIIFIIIIIITTRLYSTNWRLREEGVWLK